MPCVLRGWGALVQALGGEKPLARAKGDRALLVQATGGWTPLVWAKGSMGLCATWCLLHDLQTAGTDHVRLLGGQREVWPVTTGGL